MVLALDGSLQYVQRVPYAAILQIFYCLAWFCTVELNRLPCPNDKKYDDVVFVDRFRYHLAMFGNLLLTGLSWHIHDHNSYEIDTAKFIAAFCRISYCLYDLIRLNSIDCHVQTTRFTMMQFSLTASDINWLCLNFVTSAEVLPWQFKISPQIAPSKNLHTSTYNAKSVYEVDIEWFRLVLVISFAQNMDPHPELLACFLSHCYTCIKIWGESETSAIL